jgi:aspartyl-tRNA(Asn)/glutamyl-tRNA(Gln) amidotransferase subunit B
MSGWVPGQRVYRGMRDLWEVVIGLEIHAQISSRSKLFSAAACPTLATAPNTAVSLFDAALPGTLPSVNARAVDAAITAALALNCKVQEVRPHHCSRNLQT